MYRHFIALFIAIFIIGVLPLAAQTSSLQGAIKDPSGALVPGAVITITNIETSASRQELSDDSGNYGFLQVLPGPYKVEVQLPGFTTKVSQVVLQVGEPLTLNLELAVGQASDVVSVTAETTTINTQNAAVGNPFTEKQIIELPLQTRNVVALLSLEPGVASSGQVLGGRADQNNVTLDGANVNDNRGSNGFNSVLQIPLDSVQEFKTTIAGQGADQGHMAGGQVSLITKSGTNTFHGSVYEYNRNTDFEANDWFSNRAHVARPALIRNQYGVSAGGPIKKNKLFFFYNWEGRKDRSATSAKATVPSDTLKQGIVKVLLKSGQTVTLTPADVKALDPLGIGENPYITNLMQQYPSGNNPLGASDKGLNFNQLLFNAPQPLNNYTQVGKLDYIIDNASRHTISVRGTLVGNSSVSGVALFPGQQPTQQSLDNSRGIAAHYTYVISPNLVNSFNYGYTRLGTTSTGSLNVVPGFGFTSLLPTTRASTRIAPTPNITDDLTWTRGKHTFQMGFNFIEAQNRTASYSNEPSYSFSSSVLLGLGNDITSAVTSYIQKTIPGAALSSNSNVISAFGAIFGMLNSGSATYNYGINGQAIPFGQPISRNFISRSPEEYFQDTWKAKPYLTVIAGIRYSTYGVPYAADGVQVVPKTSMNSYFAERIGAALSGVPNSAVPDANITYQIGGPVNNGPGYYPIDKKDWAPRLSLAFSPKGGSVLEKIMGEGSVLRAGGSVVYDNYGNSMAAAFSSGGSPGLATGVNQAVNTNYTTSPRYNGTPATLTTLSPASGGAFPFTPPTIVGGFTTFTAVQSDLKAPYEYLLNFNYARPLPRHMSIEIGYAGRLAHRGILQQDYGQPLEIFVDPKSRQSFVQAAQNLAQLYYSGLTTAQVKANPSLVPLQPFAENMFPQLAGFYLKGASASANLFYDAYAEYAGSWTDTINDTDRVRQGANGGCLVVTGCNTFFPTQNSGVHAYSNAATSNFHAMTISLRRTVSNGWGYDFNYTLSHAIDNASGSETSGGTNIQNAFCTRCGFGPADFDARHAVNANAVIELPVGKGKPLFGNAPKVLDGFIGGWQVATLFSFRTGTPLSCSASNQYNTNYDISSLCMLAPGVSSVPANKLQFDQLGIPSIFANTSIGADFVPGYSGQVGYRGILRGLHTWNDDMSVSKNFTIKEGYKLSFRVEAYNLTNHQVFSNPSLSISQLAGTTTAGGFAAFGSSTFGEITSSSSTPRVLQMALRFTF